MFTGVDPDASIVKTERCFEFYQLTESEKVGAAVVGLEGKALLWFQWENKRNPITRWKKLKEKLLRQFKELKEGSLIEQ